MVSGAVLGEQFHVLSVSKHQDRKAILKGDMLYSRLPEHSEMVQTTTRANPLPGVDGPVVVLKGATDIPCRAPNDLDHARNARVD